MNSFNDHSAVWSAGCMGVESVEHWGGENNWVSMKASTWECQGGRWGTMERGHGIRWGGCKRREYVRDGGECQREHLPFGQPWLAGWSLFRRWQCSWSCRWWSRCWRCCQNCTSAHRATVCGCGACSAKWSNHRFHWCGCCNSQHFRRTLPVHQRAWPARWAAWCGGETSSWLEETRWRRGHGQREHCVRLWLRPLGRERGYHWSWRNWGRRLPGICGCMLLPSNLPGKSTKARQNLMRRSFARHIGRA